MRRIWFACLVIVLGVLGAASAQAAQPLWERDGALISQVTADVRAGGLGAVAPHASALKKALSQASALFPGPTNVGGTNYILTDGLTETTAALLVAMKRGKGDVTSIDNPYPVIGLILGSFLVETGKYKDALKALDAGLKLSPLPKERFGSTVPQLLSERGIALSKLKRWKEALASYDAGLAISSMEKDARAILYRGRGFALVELGRLDEAAAAYKASLKLDPGNKIATHELAYIESLQAGGKQAEPILTAPGQGKK